MINVENVYRSLSANLARSMRAAVIFGLGTSVRDLQPFQDKSKTDWVIGMPESACDTDAVLVFGGDGTIHRHLGRLVQSQLPVLIVPAGSGNDFARALNLRTVRDSVAAWERFYSGTDKVRRVDLGVIRPSLSAAARYFCCIAGCGLDSETARLANRLPRWMRARGGYALALPAALAGFVAPRVKLSLAESLPGDFAVHADEPTTLVAFANAPAYGHGMRIAPRAVMDDGLLDVCLVGAVGKLRLLRLFPTVYSGRHLTVPEVQYFPAQGVRIEAERPLDIYADGEYVCQTPAEITVAPRALQVIGFTVLH